MKIFFIIFLFSPLFSLSQTFNEIKIDGALSSFVSKLQPKGYSVKKYFDNGAILKENGNSNETYVFVTPKNKLVYRVVVYFPKQTNWYSLKNDYENYKNLMTKKYGSPDNTYEFFSKPYYEGDGYEMTALSVEKASFYSFWDKEQDNIGISVGISKYEQIEISLDNLKNGKLQKSEKEELELNKF
jgi:hypothetical protein